MLQLTTKKNSNQSKLCVLVTISKTAKFARPFINIIVTIFNSKHVKISKKYTVELFRYKATLIIYTICIIKYLYNNRRFDIPTCNNCTVKSITVFKMLLLFDFEFRNIT